MMDRFLSTCDDALRTVFAQHRGAQACPTVPGDATELSELDKKEAGALMRVNHVGEVCAQALYTAQALATQNEALRAHFTKAVPKKPTTWPGPNNAWKSWASAPRCSTRCGTPVPLAWDCWRAGWATR